MKLLKANGYHSKNFPLAKELISDFRVHEDIEITLENEQIFFRGEVPLDNDLERLREKAYLLTRHFLKKKCCLHLTSFETKNKDSFAIGFNFNFSHSDEKFKWQVGRNKTLLLPVLFRRFQVECRKAKIRGKTSSI